MDLTVEQRFDADVSSVLELYTDPTFFTSLPATDRLATPELVSHDRDGDEVRLWLRHRFTGELPSAASRFVDVDKLTWVEQTTIDLAAASSRSVLVPDHYAKLLDASAAAAFEPAGPGTVRRVTGEVRVPVPLVGGKVEGAIVDGLREHLLSERDEAARRLAAQ